MAMQSVNVAELKNRLSHYLRLVRGGQSVLVRDRDRVIARIEPAGGPEARAGSDAARLADLEARGILEARARPHHARSVVAAVDNACRRGRRPAQRARRRAMRFWDSSALVPLIVRQSVSHRVRNAIVQKTRPRPWRPTWSTTASASRRLAGALEESASARTWCVASRGRSVSISPARKRRPRSLCHALAQGRRLATRNATPSSSVPDGHAEGAVLHTFDQRLARAASREGFRVLPESMPSAESSDVDGSDAN